MKLLARPFLPVLVVVCVCVSGAPGVAGTIIVDNVDSGFKDLYPLASWTRGTATGCYGADYVYKNTSQLPYGLVEWRPAISAPGQYDVAVWYRASANRPNNAHYVVHHAGGTTDYYVDQTTNGSSWVKLGTHQFAAGTSGCVILTSQAQGSRNVVADAVRFTTGGNVNYWMSSSPDGTGITAPLGGGPYSAPQDTVLDIQATPANGYVFKRWQVSAGGGAAAPTSAHTTVLIDVPKTITAVFEPVPGEFRAVWADAFHVGYKSKQQIDDMVAHAAEGNYNAIIVEVLAYHDTGSGGHGAYWNSNIVPRASDIKDPPAPQAPLDPLGYLVEQAHANGIEVHCWAVAYRACSKWPPNGNPTVTSRPDWIMVPSASIGTLGSVDGAYQFDPGNPEVQEYLISIVTEVCSNYDVDGWHWDYIRYTQKDAGYPSDLYASKSGLRRFQAIYGRSDIPQPDGDAQWNEFRRRTIDELIARVRGELPLISNPRQPLAHTAALISWGDAPARFTGTSAYGLFQDWEKWMREGWLDAGCPMLYYREYNEPHDDWYRNWVEACLSWRHDRHMYLGQANYLNTMHDSVTQMLYEYDQGADGTVNYSYASTADANMDGVTENDWTWYTYVGDHLFTSLSPSPYMPWRDPAAAEEGTIFGRVTSFPGGAPIDNAWVQVAGMDTVPTDGNGFYTVTMVPATGSGATHAVTAGAEGYLNFVDSAFTVLPGSVSPLDISLPRVFPEPIPLARLSNLSSLSAGDRVIVDGLIVTADPAGAGANYLQAKDRSRGVRAESPNSFPVGCEVQVIGIVGVDPNGERYLYDTAVLTSQPTQAAAPMVTDCASIGAGTADVKGLTNSALLMKTCGRVTGVASDHFILNDGSLANGGLRVSTLSTGPAPAVGKFVVASGIVQHQGEAVLRPRSPSDIEVY